MLFCKACLLIFPYWCDCDGLHCDSVKRYSFITTKVNAVYLNRRQYIYEASYPSVNVG